jgi:hypothetical protein
MMAARLESHVQSGIPRAIPGGGECADLRMRAAVRRVVAHTHGNTVLNDDRAN